MNTIPAYPAQTLLGRGRHAAVWLAVDARAGRKVALKVAPQAALARAGLPGDFSLEFAALSSVVHRHVIQVFDHGVHAGQAFLVMELAGAGPVSRSGPVPAATLAPQRVHAVMVQVASALAALHAQGWVHRDIKPANLLARSDASLALADFGCACRVGTRGAAVAGTVTGTPQYAAPEQTEGHVAQPTADVYSLGVLLHEMLTGHAPYPGETLTELYCQHQLAPVPRLPQAQCGWQPLLDSLLAKAPRERLPDGAAALHELQRLQKDLT